MPADPADIQRAIRQSRVVTYEDGGMQAAYPNARDSLDNPHPGYCEDAGDTAQVLDAIGTLIAAPRQRYLVTIGDEMWLDPLAGIPTFQLIDEELGADLPVLLTRLEVDMENETTGIEVMG